MTKSAEAECTGTKGVYGENVESQNNTTKSAGERNTSIQHPIERHYKIISTGSAPPNA